MNKIEAAAILGLTTSATKEEALAAYRIQAKIVHPDRFPEGSEAERKAASDAMARLNQAIEVFVKTPNESEQNPPENYSPPEGKSRNTSSEGSWAPGWYPDPDNPQTTLYWNGSNWEYTEESMYFNEKGDWEKGSNYWEGSYAPPAAASYKGFSKTSKIKNKGMVGPIEALVSFFANSFKIRYSSTRAEFWWIVAWSYLLDIFLYLFDTVILKNDLPSFTSFVEHYILDSEINLGYTVILLALLIPSLTLTIRRLHDVKVSGWWLPTLTLCPFIGFIFLDTLYAIWPVAIGWVVFFVLLISGSRSSKWPSLLR
jgi:uncharacterized membrane protein YhaH (DUF805 family)